MPALPPNSTDRYFLDVSVGSVDHSTVIRTGDSATHDDVIGWLTGFITDLGNNVAGTTLRGLRKQEAGAVFSFPVATGTLPTSWGFGAPSKKAAGRYLSFVGRSASGHRCRMTWWGFIQESVSDDFRVNPGEMEALSLLVEDLNSSPDIAISVNGDKPVWLLYANFGDNAHFRNKLR